MLSSRSRLVVAPAALVLALAGLHGALAAEPASRPPLGEVVDVEVVNVDLVVTDRGGQPVEGLTAADFEILEDGDRREITNFYAFDEGRLRSEHHRIGEQPVEAPQQSLTRRMALLFDSNSLVRRDRDRAVEALERFIMEQFDGSYEWAVVSYGDRVQMVQPFTSDKLAVVGALHRLKDLPLPPRRQRGANRDFLSQDSSVQRGFQRVRALDQVGPGGLSLTDFEVRQQILDNMQLLKKTSAAMVETMRAYSGLSGRKSMVLVTGVLESLPNAAELATGSFPGVGQDTDRADPLMHTMFADVQKLLAAVVQSANSSGFSIYPISSLGVTAATAPHLEIERKNSPYEDSFGQVPVGNDTESGPRLLADGTGGKYFVTSKYYEAFDDIDSRTANAYVLGFRTVRAPDRKYHRIEVRTKRPGLDVRAREGYLHMTTEDRLLEALSTPLSFPKDRGEIPVQVSVSHPQKLAADAKEYVFTVSGLMPISEITLVPSGEKADGRVGLYLAVYDATGKLVDLVRAHQDVHVPEAALIATDASQAASFALKLKLKPGAYTVSLTMMDEVTTRYGTGLERLTI